MIKRFSAEIIHLATYHSNRNNVVGIGSHKESIFYCNDSLNVSASSGKFQRRHEKLSAP